MRRACFKVCRIAPGALHSLLQWHVMNMIINALFDSDVFDSDVAKKRPRLDDNILEVANMTESS